MKKFLAQLRTLLFTVLFLWSSAQAFSQAGTHLNFDGVNDYVTAPTVNVANQSFSIEMWYKRNTAGNGISQYILSQGTASQDQLVSVAFGTTNLITFSFWGDALSSLTAITNANWHHYAFTYNSTSKLQSLYIDGVLNASRTALANTTSAGTLYIGGFLGAAQPARGDLDELRFWNYTLTATEITNRRNCEVVPGTTGLIRYYRFNQGIGGGTNTGLISLTDATAGAKHGTLTNFALSGSTSNWLAGSTITSAPVASAQSFCGSATVANLVPAPSSAIKWYTAATGGAALLTTTALATGTYYAAAVSASGCESDRTAVAVTINAIPPAPTATNPQVYAGTATIANLTAMGTNIQWYDAATGGALLAGSTTLTDGNTYYASQTVSNCESLRTLVTVRKISEATQTFCGSATVANLVTMPGSGTTANWFTAASGGTAIPNTNAITTGTYYVEQNSPASVITLGSGFSNPSGVAIQADGKIVVADYNNNVIKRMNADGTGIVTLGGGFSGPRGVAVQADGKIVVADYGNSLIKRMNADGTGIITLGSGFNHPYGVAIQADGKIVVGDQFNGAIKRMNADGTGIVTLGSGFSDPTGVAIQADGKIVATIYSGNTIIRMNADGTGIVTLGGAFGSPLGVAIQPDGKIISANINSKTVKRMNADGTGIVTLGSGFLGPMGVDLQTDGKIVVADYFDNAIKRITEASISNRVAVSVTVNAIPAAPAAAAQSFCGSGTVADLVATGTNIKWYAAATGGTALVSTTSITTATTYYASQTVNGCESNTRTGVLVTINVIPAAPAAIAQSFCGSATVADLTATGAAIQWYDMATGGTALATTAALTTATTYYASQTVNGCESSARTAVLVTINAIPSVDAVSNQTLCNGTATAAVTFTGAVPGTSFNWTNDNTGIGLAAAGTGNIPGFTATNTGTTAVTATVTVTPITGGVFAYITNNSNKVSVINTANHILMATVTVGSFPQGVSASPDGSRVYVANEGSGNVSVINTATNTVVTTVAVGSSPSGICISPDGSKVYVTNLNSDNVSVISTTTNTIVATIAVGAAPWGICVSPDGGKVYVANTISGNISVINTATNAVTATIVAGLGSTGVWVSPDGNKVYVANQGSNSVSVINTATNTVIATVAVGTRPMGVSVSADGSKLYVTNANSHNVSVINTVSNSVVATVVVGADPGGVSVSPDGSKVYVVNKSSNNISVINTFTNTVVATLAVGSAPFSLGNFLAIIPPNCTGTPQTFTYTVNPSPAAPAASAQSFCGPATVASLAATGTGIKWYAAATGGTALASTTALTTTTYYVSQTVSTCESPRTSVSVTANNIPIPPPAVTTIYYVQGSTASLLTATGTNLLWYTVATGGSGSVTAPLPSTALVGTTSYWVSQTVSTCESPRKKIDVIVKSTATHLNFDGTNDMVSVGSIIPNASSYTKEAWIYSTINTGARNIFSSFSNPFWIFNGNLAAGNNGTITAVQDPAAFPLNAWTHVAVTYDASTNTMRLYKNGVLVSTNTSTPSYVAQPGFIGSHEGTASFFQGNMDEVRIWNVARSAAQIAGSRNCPLAGNENGLIAYYRFDQGFPSGNNLTVTTLNDATANNNNGTLSGFNLTGNSSNWLMASPLATGPDVVSTVNYCLNETAGTLAAPGTGLLWYTTMFGGTGSSTAPIPATNTAGTTSYWVTQPTTSCGESPRSKIDVIVNLPAIAITDKVQTLVVSANTQFSNNCLDLITTVNPTGASPISGSTTAKVWIEGTQNAQFAKRHYEITPATNAATGRITLYFTQANFDDFNAVNTVDLPTGPADAPGIGNLLIEKRSGISSDGTGLPSTYTGSVITIDPADADIVWNSTQSRWEISFDVTGFSGFFVKTLNGLLPLNLLSFNGSKLNNNDVLLQWQTTHEVNSSHFEMEISSNGNSFAKLGTVTAKNTSGINNYQYMDNSSWTSDIRYYRLKMIDNNGKFNYSTVIKMNTKQMDGISIYPNPVTDAFVLNTNNSLLNTTVKIMDMSGSTVMVFTVNSRYQNIDISHFAKGMYLLRFVDGNTLKLIKQ